MTRTTPTPSFATLSALDRYRRNRCLLSRSGLYSPQHERDNCGVGLVAAIDGKASRRLVEAGLEALQNINHRGAVDADGKSGDGAGVMLQVPQEFFRKQLAPMGTNGSEGPIAVGMVFLPKLNLAQQERCRQIIEHYLIGAGYDLFGWRQVPIRLELLGETASATKPEIEQILFQPSSWAQTIAQGQPITDEDLAAVDAHLYGIRRQIEATLREHLITNAYICSLSCRQVIYKSLCLANQLARFYPDLADPSVRSNFILYHQRYSTNTFPSWESAQPFRTLAHNGEINTLGANVSQLGIHETAWLEAQSEGGKKGDFDPASLVPIVPKHASDSQALDSIVEFMLRQKRDLPDSLIRIMPSAEPSGRQDTEQVRAFTRYTEALYQPWDGPASICAFGGRWVVARLDRQGLRPARYSIDDNGLLVVGSEVGLVRDHLGPVLEYGQLGPGEMIGVDLHQGILLRNESLREYVAQGVPCADWQKSWRPLQSRPLRPLLKKTSSSSSSSLTVQHIAAGWTHEDLELIVHPASRGGKESIGSMGDDSPLSVFTGEYRGLHHFFRQHFAQVTNPAVDSLRERSFMSLRSHIGPQRSCLLEEGSWDDLTILPSPVISPLDLQALNERYGPAIVAIEAMFSVPDGDPRFLAPLPTDQPTNSADQAECHAATERAGKALWQSLNALQSAAAQAVEQGAHTLVLQHVDTTPSRALIPSALALSAVRQHLKKQKLLHRCSVVLEAQDVLDSHSLAVSLGLGAMAVCPRLAFDTIWQRSQHPLADPALTPDTLWGNFVQSLQDGLLKIMAKCGIATISSYRGGCFFEIIGLSRSVVSHFFPELSSRLSGLGLSGLATRLLALHNRAHNSGAVIPIGGFYRQRHGGGQHVWHASAIHTLQQAVTTESFDLYRRYTRTLYQHDAEPDGGLPSGPSAPSVRPTDLRQLLDIHNPTGKTLHLSDVTDSVSALRRRLLAPAISLGALSPVAHETLAIAMNRIGSRSNCGEGGEDPVRFHPRRNGDNARSAIKQVASGRFGVTAEYLCHCAEIEIKIAQGAKPGEGGHLPGIKVSSLIARLRHSTPGVTLISPPPHHDIYSIEDLAQLIYDLKQINPEAEICVKLVARAGIGAVAAGVAKAHADVILISGHSGGTGASPLSSIKFAGSPWEMGLSEAHQVLTLNRLRQKVKLRVDGGIRCGRDVVVAAALGAEEFGVGTAGLVAMGCLMVRQCHSNTCPVGICTQRPQLIDKFRGTPEKVINLFTFIAEDIRRILADLGVKRLNDIIGQTQYLRQISRGWHDLDDLDLNPLLVKPDIDNQPAFCTRTAPTPVMPSLDEQILQDIAPLFEHREKMLVDYAVHNYHRSIGTRIAGAITRNFGQSALAPRHLQIRLRGSSGQSLGAFAVEGMHIDLVGEANDYVGKSLCGATIVIRPDVNQPLQVERPNAICGNTVLYGATRGELFAAGRAGERFAVRNSGATAVIEGCGANGCEYMTGGVVVILGPVGENFGAGMTGGETFVYDPDRVFTELCNPEHVGFYPVDPDSEAEKRLFSLIEAHIHHTGSPVARQILAERPLHAFHRIVPHEILRLERTKTQESEPPEDYPVKDAI